MQGPFLIENNYLEAATENLMFGGSDPAISGLIPSDITITGNNLTKPLTWLNMKPSWSIKVLLELKNARRVLITDNTLTGCWGQSQVGYAIDMTPRNQNGKVHEVASLRNM